MQIIILSGVSGSGKSTAIKAMEDIDFFCVDNLPPKLIPTFIDLCSNSDKEISKVALVIDIRIPDTKILEKFSEVIEEIKSKASNVEIIFLESSNQALVKRYKETRRKHPLSQNGNILDGIKEEREILSHIKKISDHEIDTSEYNVHQLKEKIQNIFRTNSNQRVSLNFLSFGFKHGYPLDADLVFDVRFLPNPYFVESLKDLDGTNQEIKDFVLSSDDSKIFIEKVLDLLNFLIPKFKKEGKSYINMAIGCTGGKHRSVAIANEIAQKFTDFSPSVRHRDIEKN